MAKPARNKTTNKPDRSKKPDRPQTGAAAKKARSLDFPVVGVGASAGGLDAFKRFLSAVPADSGVAYVLVQHLDPNHESLMAELLARHAAVPVVEAGDGMAIEPNHAYMIPPNKFLRIADHGLFLDEPTHRRGMRMPIDYFFRSLAEARAEAAICVILSGTGTDGSLGLKEIKAAGGMAMVEKPETAEYDGMPRAALSTGMVDFVLPIGEMPGVLLDYLKHPYLRTQSKGTGISQSEPDTFRAILNLLRAHTDYDFRCYKPGTLDRRIHRRMSLRHIQHSADYLDLLRQDGDELRLLFKDLLIGVTRFFRDPEVWEALRHDVIAPMIEAKKHEEPIRAWVVGCATGEEAYSLAMTLSEEADSQKKRVPIQIYATDLDPDAIETARAGWYPASIVSDVSPQRLSRFFIEDKDGYRAGKLLRESVVFATQNVIGDPPFSRLDLISCRNLLIYLETRVQSRLMELYHFALREGGYLFLGTSESVGESGKHFAPVSKTYRIYRRTGTLKPGQGSFPIVPGHGEQRGARLRHRPTIETTEGARAETAKRILLEQFAPASVLVNRKFEVQYFHGPVRDYLDYPTGEPEVELPNLAMEGMKAKVRSTLARALHDNDVAEDVARSVKRNGGRVAVRILVRPIAHQGEDGPLLLVSFRDEPQGRSEEKKHRRKPTSDEEASTIQQLEFELQATREDLQSTIEEVETSNEELKASNEEVMSMNEELQSANEELETSREELQSLNEELTTVNNQLQDKVQELEDTNNDLTNLLDSTEIATLFLDTTLKIRRFTPAAGELLHVIDGDVGRPIDDLAPRLNDPELIVDAQRVLRHLQPLEAEVTHESGRAFLRRVLPYRTSDNKIDGVVVTFADVTPLRRAAQQLKRRESQQATIAELGQSALSGMDIQTLLETAAAQLAERLDCPLTKVLELGADKKSLLLRAGVGWSQGLVGRETVSAGMESQAGYTLSQSGPVIVKNLAEERRFAGPALLLEHDVVSGVSVIIGPPERPWGVLGVHSVTSRRFTVDDVNFVQAIANVLHLAIEGERMASRLRLALDAAKLATWDWDPKSDTSVWHERLYDLIDLPRDAAAEGATFFDRVHPDDVGELKEIVKSAMDRRDSFEHEFRVVHRDGSVRWLTAFGMAAETGQYGEVRLVGVNRDITAEKIAQQKLIESEERHRLAMEATADLVYDWDLRTNTVLRSEGLYGMIGVRPSDATPDRQWWLSRIHPDDRDRVVAEVTAALKEGDEYFGQRYRVRHEEDGSWIHIRDQGMIIRDENGKARRIVGSRRDVTEQIEMDSRLRDAEERRRLALEATRTGTWEWRAGSRTMIWDARQCEIYGLRPAEEIPLKTIRERLPPDDAEKRDQLLRAALESGEPYECEVRLISENGHTRWIAEKGNALGEGEDRRLIGISFDVTEVKEAQARDALLLAELDHRVKNILANIQAVARQSVKGKKNSQDFVTALEGRLHALSNTHSLLSSMKWNGVEVVELMEAIFAPYTSPGNQRLSLDGPRLTLSPGAAQSVALTIHELTTNAAKHGALSKEDGTVGVEWKKTTDDGEPVVVLTWAEAGGPPVTQPKEKHFGLKVIESLVVSELGATVDMDFKNTGLVCKMTFPRDRLLAKATGKSKQGAALQDAVASVNAETLSPGTSEPLRLMVVEDSWMVASQLKVLLEALGHEVIGPAATVAEAEALSEMDGIDAALLDIQLGDETVFPVAEKIAALGIPFAFVTGFTDAGVIPTPYRDAPSLSKPFNDEAVVAILKRLRPSPS